MRRRAKFHGTQQRHAREERLGEIRDVPTAQIAVMGAEGAINVLYRKQPKEAADQAGARAELVNEYREKFSKPYVAAAAAAIDDILIPSETRPRLIAALELLRDKRVKSPAKKHGTMPL